METKDNPSIEPLPESLRSSFESFMAALWLITDDNFPQALSLLHNSIELAFKAELEQIHPLLIADSKRLDYETLKIYLREEFLKHPRGLHINILYCPICGLHISAKDKYLAEYHVGEIEQSIIDSFFAENHEALKFDGLL
jgi:hypothetical protein